MSPVTYHVGKQLLFCEIKCFIFFLQFAGFGGGIFESMPRTFNRQYRCYSVMLCPGNEREDVEKGGKSKYLKPTLSMCVVKS